MATLLHVACAPRADYTQGTACHSCGSEPVARSGGEEKTSLLGIASDAAPFDGRRSVAGGAFFFTPAKEQHKEQHVVIERRGEVVTFTLHPEARDILRVLCPNSKAFGQFVSRLLFEEERRQQDQRRLREQFHQLVDTVLVP